MAAKVVVEVVAVVGVVAVVMVVAVVEVVVVGGWWLVVVVVVVVMLTAVVGRPCPLALPARLPRPAHPAGSLLTRPYSPVGLGAGPRVSSACVAYGSYPDVTTRPRLLGPDPHSFTALPPDESKLAYLAAFVNATMALGVRLAAVTHHGWPARGQARARARTAHVGGIFFYRGAGAGRVY